MTLKPGAHMLCWVLETAMALVITQAMLIAWPTQGKAVWPGPDAIWFALGWLVLLALPATWRLFLKKEPKAKIPQTMNPEVCGQAAFFMAFAFVILLLAGQKLGNFKLWLGIVYLLAIILRLAGVSLRLRAYILTHPEKEIAPALVVAAISALAAILLIPWVRPDLAAVWPPVTRELAILLGKALLWGGISGAAFLNWRLYVGRERTAWLLYLAIGLGPGPTLAVTWFYPAPMAIALLILGATAFFRYISPKRTPMTRRSPKPVSLYWLLRSMTLLWWGLGACLALASAWWQPHMESLFSQAVWVRALLLGGFLVICLGVLAEYSLPLFGRPGTMTGSDKERKVLGVVLSALALLGSLPMLLFTPPWQDPVKPKEYEKQAIFDLIEEPITLDAQNTSLDLTPPLSLGGFTHVYVVSRMENAPQVPQGTTVARLTVNYDLDPRRTFNLRAGIDTAEGDLAKRDIAVNAKHRPARVADSRIIFSKAGEAYASQSFVTGLFLGQRVNRIYSLLISLSVLEGEDKDLKLHISRIFAY